MSDVTRYPAELVSDVVSGGDLRYAVRPIRPGDAARLVAFHARLSPQSSYFRYFTYHPTLSSKEVDHFTHVDYEDRLALVAELDDQIIGVGRYDRQPGSDEAEVAFVVADEFQGHGIASLLLDELARAARDRGIRTFLASTMLENRQMLDVFLHSGYPVSRSLEYGTVSLVLPLAETASSRRALASRDATRQVSRRACPPSAS
jgi:GNAT superfamily N-acetyltransferase